MTDGPVPYDSLERVCVRAPNWVGDVVMAVPTLRAIRNHFPSARVTLVIRSRVEPVLRGSPWFNETLVYRPADGHPMREFMRCVKELRRDAYELGFVLPNSFSSALMMRLGGVARRVGYARDCRSFLLTDAVPRPSEDRRFRPTYMVDYYLGLCEEAGILPQERRVELPFTEADAGRAEEILRAQGIDLERPLFLLHPGAGFGPAKRWPAERFSRLAELLKDTWDAEIGIIAGRDERATVGAIIDGTSARAVDLSNCGVDLHLLKCIVARSALLVTTDSGPRHYGVGLGVPTICIMGPNHPGYSTSTNPNDHVVRLDVPCGPCQKKTCPREHQCMTGITAEMVLAACQAALSDSDGGLPDDTS